MENEAFQDKYVHQENLLWWFCVRCQIQEKQKKNKAKGSRKSMSKTSVQWAELIQAQEENSSVQNQEQDQAVLLYESSWTYDDNQ